MNELPFSYNWNNKLDCKVYTTFRPYNPKKHFMGAKFRTHLKGQYLHDAEVIGVKRLRIEQVNEWIAGIDTGYTLEEFISVVSRMYGENYREMQYVLLLLRRL